MCVSPERERPRPDGECVGIRGKLPVQASDEREKNPAIQMIAIQMIRTVAFRCKITGGRTEQSCVKILAEGARALLPLGPGVRQRVRESKDRGVEAPGSVWLRLFALGVVL